MSNGHKKRLVRVAVVLRLLATSLALANDITAANAQLPPDPKPIGLPPDPKYLGSPDSPTRILPPATPNPSQAHLPSKAPVPPDPKPDPKYLGSPNNRSHVERRSPTTPISSQAPSQSGQRRESSASSSIVPPRSAVVAGDDGGWINRIDVERLVPPPPARGSRIEKDEIAEIYKAQAAATPAAKALAKHDNDVEDPSIFADVIGPRWNMTKLPKTAFLMEKVMDVDRPDSGSAKWYFKRPRPWMVDPKIQTCASYPSGP